MTFLSLKQPNSRATTNLEVFCEDTWEANLAMQNIGMQRTICLASHRIVRLQLKRDVSHDVARSSWILHVTYFALISLCNSLAAFAVSEFIPIVQCKMLEDFNFYLPSSIMLVFSKHVLNSGISPLV